MPAPLKGSAEASCFTKGAMHKSNQMLPCVQTVRMCCSPVLGEICSTSLQPTTMPFQTQKTSCLLQGTLLQTIFCPFLRDTKMFFFILELILPLRLETAKWKTENQASVHAGAIHCTRPTARQQDPNGVVKGEAIYLDENQAAKNGA